MANVQTYSWPALSTTSIAAAQTTAGAGTLLLNGSLAVSTDNGQFINLYDIARVVTLTSVNDLHSVNVTVTGIQDGAVVTETRTGPTSNTVATTALFNQVTSITVDGAVTALSAGTGSTGMTGWFRFDSMASVANLAIEVVVSGTINYSWQVTLDSPNNANTNPPATVFAPTVFTPITLMTSATTTLLGNYTAPFKYCNLIINSSSAGGSLTLKLLQQGLHS